MRSLEYLIQLFPEKTGKEILDIQNQDKLKDKEERDKINSDKLALIEDYNKNGAYFKSTFGKNQYRYDRFYNLQLDSANNIRCSVESIVGFYGGPNKSLSINRTTDSYKRLDYYSIHEDYRISKSEYDFFSSHLNSIFNRFWEEIDQSQF